MQKIVRVLLQDADRQARGRGKDCPASFRAARAAGTALLFFGAVLPAHAVDPRPGLWKLTSKSERGSVTVGERAATSCLTREGASALVRPSIDPALDSRNECKVVASRRTVNGLTTHIQCAGPVPVDSKTEYVFSAADRYSAVMSTTITLVRKPLTSTLRVEAQRIGDCP
jgi:hypothetical protein